MILDPRILRFTLTLAGELHFGRAAAKLHVSQPGLSITIRNLERDLGVQLFHRTSRHVELTDAGRVFVDEARKLVAHSERVISIVRGTASDFAGPLKVGYPPSISLEWLCPLISRIRQDARLGTAVQFLSGEPVELENELAQGTIHAAFLTGPVANQKWGWSRLFRESFLAVMASGHALAGRNGLSASRLQGEPVIWLRQDLNPGLYQSFLSACSLQGYAPRIVQEVRTFHECLEFAREGPGITFLPASIERRDRYAGISFLELAQPFYLESALVFHRDHQFEKLKWLIRFIERDAGVVVSAAASRYSGADR
jgi:DNA-binding transcriptional LysR family regulator